MPTPAHYKLRRQQFLDAIDAPVLLMAGGGRIPGRRLWPFGVWLQAAHAATWWPPGAANGWWGGLPWGTWALLAGLWLVPLFAVAGIAAAERDG